MLLAVLIGSTFLLVVCVQIYFFQKLQKMYHRATERESVLVAVIERYEQTQNELFEFLDTWRKG